MQANSEPKKLNNLLSNKKFSKETINSLNYLCNIYFIDKEYYNDSMLNKKKK